MVPLTSDCASSPSRTANAASTATACVLEPTPSDATCAQMPSVSHTTPLCFPLLTAYLASLAFWRPQSDRHRQALTQDTCRDTDRRHLTSARLRAPSFVRIAPSVSLWLASRLCRMNWADCGVSQPPAASLYEKKPPSVNTSAFAT